MDLLSRGVFIIAPERIYLKKNEKRAFIITYSHVEEGVHELQVQVSITNGRVFILHLIGQTLGKDEPAVLAPIEQRFLPIALGEIISPRQIVKLTNPGKVGVNYAFLRPEMFIYSAEGELILLDQDSDSPQQSNLALQGLRCFSVENHENSEDTSVVVQKELTVRQNVTDILTCLNPRGYLAPNSSINIVFSFSPKCVGFHHFKVGLVIYPTSKPGIKLERPRSHGLKEVTAPGASNEEKMEIIVVLVQSIPVPSIQPSLMNAEVLVTIFPCTQQIWKPITTPIFWTSQRAALWDTESSMMMD